MPVAMAKMLGSKMMSSGGKPSCLDQEVVGALADLGLAREGVGLALLVEGHDHHGGAMAPRDPCASWMNFSSPSFIEIELTTGLPCTHFRPASITANFEESTITGTRAMSGSAATRLRNVTIAASGIEQALVHVDVDDLGAVLDLVARDLRARRRSRPP